MALQFNQIWKALAAGCLLLLGAGLAAVGEEERVMAGIRSDPATGAAHVWSAYGGLTRACADEELGLDGAAVIDAIQTVERAGNAWPKRAAEWLVYVSLGPLLGSPPDLSYGPMQIRLSKLRAIAGDGPAPNPFDICAARLAARRLLTAETGLDLGPSVRLDRPAVRRAAQFYNGQREARAGDAERQLANAVYNELVYHVFQEARFARRQSAELEVPR